MDVMTAEAIRAVFHLLGVGVAGEKACEKLK
jgi:hypothetical protein